MNRKSARCLLIVALAVAPRLAAAAGVQVVNASGAAGSTVAVGVTLSAGASDLVAGTQNDITYDPTMVTVAAVASNSNKPDCTVNPDINKKIDGSQTFGFGFLKDGVACDPTADTCNTVRAIVLATDNVDPIPAGSTLYTCNFTISASAASGTSIPLTVGTFIGSDPNGQKLASFTGGNGQITVASVTACVGACGSDASVGLSDLRISLNIFTGVDTTSTCQGISAGNLAGLRHALNNFVNHTCS